jgi:hypothetical protein
MKIHNDEIYSSDYNYQNEKSLDMISRNEIRKSLNLSHASQRSEDTQGGSKTTSNKIKKEITSFVKQLEKEKDFKASREKSSSMKANINRNSLHSSIQGSNYGSNLQNLRQSQNISSNTKNLLIIQQDKVEGNIEYTKFDNSLSLSRKNEATRNLRTEDEEEIGRHILTFSKPFETQTGKSSFSIRKGE